MVCLITSIDFLSIQPFIRPLFSGQQELSNLDYYLQNGGKTGAQTNQSFWKLINIFWWSKISHIIIKGWNFLIKSFSGQVAFCFAILRAISAYVGENWLSQYIYFFISHAIPLNLLDSFKKTNLSHDMGFPTMWYVIPAQAQIIHAVWLEPLLVAWIFYVC